MNVSANSARDRKRARWLALAAFVFVWSMTTHGKYSASGDEPHYLMIAQSLVVDHDLDVENNYAANGGRLFGHDHLDMGLHARRARTGRLLPIHDVGLGVLVAPVYAVARQLAVRVPESWLRRVRMDDGLFTYSVISLFLAALTCVAMVFVADGVSSIAPAGAAAWLTFAAWVSPPIVSHAFLVFPEVPALFVTSLVVWFTLSAPNRRDAIWLVILAALIGTLPWMHHKFLLYSPALAILVGWRRAEVVRALPRGLRVLAAAAFIVPPLLLLAWSWHEWGTLGGALTVSGMPFSFADFKQGFFGLWIDRQSGLLAYAPLYWIVPACCWTSPRNMWLYLLPFVAIYIPAAAFVIGWWAGFSPAARYLVPAMPLLLVPIGSGLRHRPIRMALCALAVAQAAVDVVVWQHPRWLWPSSEGNLMLAALRLPGRAYAWFLPAIQGRGLSLTVVWVTAVWAIVSGVLVVLVTRSYRPNTRASSYGATTSS